MKLNYKMIIFKDNEKGFRGFYMPRYLQIAFM